MPIGNMRSGRNTSRATALSPSQLERKRASDRESQRATRARTKAYIEHLERITNILAETGSGNGASVSERLREQYEEIESLKNIIGSIARLANSVQGLSPPSPSSNLNTLESRDQTHPTPPKTPHKGAIQDAAAELNTDHQEDVSNPAFHPKQESFQELYPEVDVTCSDQDRDYFEALNQALVMIEDYGKRHRFSSPDVDDDITIRAVLHGWPAAEAKNPFDIGWQLLRNLDCGLFFRSGPVERIATLRLIRSMLMVLEPHFYFDPVIADSKQGNNRS